jgi:hypothetical protein
MKLLPTGLRARLFGLIALAVLLGVLPGCSGGEGFDLAYTGGGLPPGDPDIGGIVVASADGMETAQGDSTEGLVPVPGATVRLIRGRAVVGVAVSGDEGYFRFDNPAAGRYALEIHPPAGSGLQRTRLEVEHQAGQQTFVEVHLQPDRGDRGLPL